MANLCGQIIDKYRILSLLGEGGMGAVYEAEHTLIGRRCAIKALHPEHAEDREVTRRMLREARAAAAIGHPNIVETHDFGVTDEGLHYMVMELLSGQSVGDIIRERGRLEVEVGTSIVWQVLGALAVAHDKGIVHRDLKPDNLFVAKNPHGGEMVKILDFGISMFRPKGENVTRLTSTGAVMGTAAYMSPEQAAGADKIDHRSDLWSMGVILYQMLTGKLPFPGSNYNQVIVTIVTEEPARPTHLRPNLSQGIESVIWQALRKDPADRFQTAVDMRAAIRGYLGELKPSTGSLTLPTNLLAAFEPQARLPRRLGSQETLAYDDASLPSSGTDPTILDDPDSDPMTTAEAEPRAEAPAPDGAASPAEGDQAIASGESASPPPEVPEELLRSIGTEPRGELSLHRGGGARSNRGRNIGLAVAAVMLVAGAVVTAFILGGRSGGRGAAQRAEPTAASATETDGAPSPARIAAPTPRPEAMAKEPASAPERSLPVTSSPTAGLVTAVRQVRPPSARVTLDGQPRSVPITLAADGKAHQVRVFAPGYRTRTFTFQATPSAKSLVVLLRRARPTRRRTARARPRARPRRRPMTRPAKSMGGFYGNPFGK